VARLSRAAKRKSVDGQADAQKPVLKLPPEEPAARDEGPRLIPFPAELRSNLDPPRVKHYLELAEKALDQGRKKTE
jgi:hypothetical protein